MSQLSRISRCALSALIILAMSAAVALAQTPTASSTDRIRAQAQRMKEYRALLADPDSNIRLATLDEMLKSTDAAIRELAFEAGFASADQNMRALTLKARIFSMKSFVLEPQNAAKLADQEWQKLTRIFALNLGFRVLKFDPQTGNVELSGGTSGHVAGQEFAFSSDSGSQFGAVRLRLTDGAVMTGTYSKAGQTVSVKLPLQ